jgi:hypothetical protein
MAISPVFRPFEKLPTEIFEEIAFQVTTHSKVGPPVGLVSLLRLSRSIHALLDFKRNPDFYARLFRFKFNMSAAIRRFKYSRVETDRQRLQSSNLAMELKRRFKGMKRMRRAARAQSIVKTCSDEECRDDLWMAYLMLLESDGLNMDQLVLYGCLHHYIIIYRNEELFPAIVRPGFPLDRVERSLALWLLWFMSDARESFFFPFFFEDALSETRVSGRDRNDNERNGYCLGRFFQASPALRFCFSQSLYLPSPPIRDGKALM